MAEPIISLEALAEHNSDESLWIAVRGSVFDLTTFCRDHPGGMDVLRECAGTDGTEPFEYAGHSEAAFDMMTQFRVGELAGHSTKTPKTAIGKQIGLTTSPAQNRSDILMTALRSANLLRRALSLMIAVGLALALFIGLRFVGRRNHAHHFSEVQTTGGHIGFWSALVLAGCVNVAGFGYGYRKFAETLHYNNEVFAYPAMIPRLRK